jgi:hypothetical protein
MVFGFHPKQKIIKIIIKIFLPILLIKFIFSLFLSNKIKLFLYKLIKKIIEKTYNILTYLPQSPPIANKIIPGDKINKKGGNKFLKYLKKNKF